MTRVVADPNVLVSALISPHGAPAEIVRLWSDGAFDLVASRLLFDELDRILGYRKIADRVDASLIDSFVDVLTSHAIEIEDPDDSARYVESDPADDYLVALAKVADAHVIVSGDRHLTELVGIRPPALTPREFLERLSRSG